MKFISDEFEVSKPETIASALQKICIERRIVQCRNKRHQNKLKQNEYRITQIWIKGF